MQQQRRHGCGCGTVLFVLFFVLVIAGFTAWRLGYVDRLFYQLTMQHETETISPEDLASIERGTASYYVYGTLGAEDREKYAIVYDAMVTREPRAYPETDMDDLARIRDCVLSDHPELFYVTGIRLLTTTNAASGLVTEVTVEGQFSYSPEEAVAAQNALDAASQACLAGMPEEAAHDDYAKAKYLYEFLARTVEYDHDAAATARLSGAGGEEGTDGATASGQTAVDALVTGKAVCGGYASAFQYLMQKLGVECTYVVGDALGGSHAWCLCLLDGAYYYVDPTWGDPQFTDDAGTVTEREGMVNYNYLCDTTADIVKTHAISDLFEVPECTADADNYYVREDLLFDWADEARLGNLAARAIAIDASVQVRCTNEEAFRELLGSLVETGRLAEYLPGDSYHYSYSEDFRSITILP